MQTNQLVLNEDELVLSLIATGLVQLHESISSGQKFRYPYPPPLERGLNKLTVLRMMRGEDAPQGIPDLLLWCTKPLGEWQLDLPKDAINEHDQLLNNQIPTNLCESWACANPDVEAELSEQRLMKSLFELCQTQDDENLYVAVRKLFITDPVLTALDFQQAQIEPDLMDAAEIIRKAYSPAPTHTLLDGQYNCCSQCGNLLMRTPGNDLICENDRCSVNGIEVGRTISEKEQAYWLIRGLRRFVNAPGIAEINLKVELEARGLAVELWPSYDRYDLRIHLPDGKVWAIDVKDWANPFLLAKRVQPIPKHPEWDKAFFVFPDERFKQRGDYLRAFRNNTNVLGSQTQAMFVWQFLHLIDQQI